MFSTLTRKTLGNWVSEKSHTRRENSLGIVKTSLLEETQKNKLTFERNNS